MDSPTPGESKLHPISIDSSALSVPVSSVKIASSKALPKCRYELDYVLQLLVFYLKRIFVGNYCSVSKLTRQLQIWSHGSSCSIKQQSAAVCECFQQRPDFTNLALHGMPSGRGKKGGQAPRIRKKAPDPTTNHVERLTTAVSTETGSW